MKFLRFAASLISRVLSILKTFLVKCNRKIVLGSKSLLYHRSSIQVTGSGKVLVGNNCVIGRSRRYYHGGMPFHTVLWAEGDGSMISVGDNCRINGAYIHARSDITIGENCVFATGISVLDTNGHETDSADRTKGSDAPMPIKIGNNVWIGMNAIILKGSVIGDNSIVSAGSIVKGTFPANSLICGNPAALVKTLDIS